MTHYVVDFRSLDRKGPYRQETGRRGIVRRGPSRERQGPGRWRTERAAKRRKLTSRITPVMMYFVESGSSRDEWWVVKLALEIIAIISSWAAYRATLAALVLFHDSKHV